jgi:hypothetical protein
MGRGPHAADPTLFAPRFHPDLRRATADLSWLLGRGYAEPSSLKLVGDRYGLRQRQRAAVRRAACSDAARDARAARRLTLPDLEGRPLAVDGFNVVIVVESALAGAVLVRGRDSVLRDLASVHGNYRRVDTTQKALAAIRDAIAEAKPSRVSWYLDRPVSNSGRLRDWILDLEPRWTVELPFDPDPVLAQADAVVATADANILDGDVAWIDLPALTTATRAETAWVVDLS